MVASICICDDDPVIGELLSIDLRTAGFQVAELLTSIEEAIGFMSITAPDVLLLDLNMPSGGGLELLSYLKSQGLLVNTRVVMLTGEQDISFVDRAKRLGASGYLVKPVKKSQLVDKIQRILSDQRVGWTDDFATVAAPRSTGLMQRAVRHDPAPIPIPIPSLADLMIAKAQRRRILSVEDVACNQQLISLFLDDAVYAVDQVQTGADALTAIEAINYDLVLMDLRLPDIDGLDVVRRIRLAEGGGLRLPIVAVTADVLASHVSEAMAAGVDDFVAKPFTSAALRAAVELRLGAPGATLESLNPIVAELTQSYGKLKVEKLLRALLGQLSKLDAAPAEAVDLEHTAHAIRGAASSLGFSVVSNACSELESACRAGAVLGPRLTSAAAACARARTQIANCLAMAA